MWFGFLHEQKKWRKLGATWQDVDKDITSWDEEWTAIPPECPLVWQPSSLWPSGVTLYCVQWFPMGAQGWIRLLKEEKHHRWPPEGPLPSPSIESRPLRGTQKTLLLCRKKAKHDHPSFLSSSCSKAGDGVRGCVRWEGEGQTQVLWCSSLSVALRLAPA